MDIPIVITPVPLLEIGNAPATSVSTRQKRSHEQTAEPGTKRPRNQKSTSFECQNCASSFSCNKDLKRHNDSFHLNLRPFNCRYCTKTFTQKVARKIHENTHSGDTPYKCRSPDCSVKFGDPSRRNAHEKQIHAFVHAPRRKRRPSSYVSQPQIRGFSPNDSAIRVQDPFVGPRSSSASQISEWRASDFNPALPGLAVELNKASMNHATSGVPLSAYQGNLFTFPSHQHLTQQALVDPPTYFLSSVNAFPDQSQAIIGVPGMNNNLEFVNTSTNFYEKSVLPNTNTFAGYSPGIEASQQVDKNCASAQEQFVDPGANYGAPAIFPRSIYIPGFSQPIYAAPGLNDDGTALQGNPPANYAAQVVVTPGLDVFSGHLPVVQASANDNQFALGYGETGKVLDPFPCSSSVVDQSPGTSDNQFKDSTATCHSKAVMATSRDTIPEFSPVVDAGANYDQYTVRDTENGSMFPDSNDFSSYSPGIDVSPDRNDNWSTYEETQDVSGHSGTQLGTLLNLITTSSGTNTFENANGNQDFQLDGYTDPTVSYVADASMPLNSTESVPIIQPSRQADAAYRPRSPGAPQASVAFSGLKDFNPQTSHAAETSRGSPPLSAEQGVEIHHRQSTRHSAESSILMQRMLFQASIMSMNY